MVPSAGARASLCLVVAIAVVASLIVVESTGAQSASAMRQGRAEPREVAKFRVVDHNIQRRSDALRRAIRKARHTDAQVITLQEVCWWQVRDLRARHPHWKFAWQADRKTSWCERVDRSNQWRPVTRFGQGNVTISTNGLGAASAIYFKNQLNRGRRQGMACLTWKKRGLRRHTCSLHLISGSEPRHQRLRMRQAREVARATSEWTSRGALVVLGGDFNAAPNHRPLDYLYRFRGRGAFREATPRYVGGNRDCRCSATTFDGGRTKIDYIFFSANRMASTARRQLLIYPTGSDHHLLVGWAKIDTRARMGASDSR